jgi:sugar phosphate isomerase/epimerase
VLADDRFGMLIDLGHLNLRRHKEAYFGRLTAIQYILRAPLPIIEVHIHDNTGERDSHQALGEGNLALDDVIYGLHKAGFDGVSTVELVPAFHDSNSAVALPKVRESLELWRTTWEESAMECCGADEQ